MQYWGMLHLTGLIVKQGVRKRGVGTALMEQVEKYARETGVCVMTVETFDFQVSLRRARVFIALTDTRVFCALCGHHADNFNVLQ